jgi:hypothetical protein
MLHARVMILKIACRIGQTTYLNLDILCGMITGAHFLLYSKNAEADRAFFRDILGLSSVDVGHGWLIFGMNAAEAAIHPLEQEEFSHEHAGQEMLGGVLYLMCDDLDELIGSLQAHDVHCTPLQTAPWGITTSIPLPSGGKIGLSQPRHPTALHLKLSSTQTA